MGAHKLHTLEASNHLGNVLTLFTDKKIPVGTGTTVSYYKADLVSSMDYSPFGAPLKGRTFNGSGSRYGFNGQEKDNEVAGAGNSMTAEYWQYDSRLGRRWNIDPVPQIKRSDYSCLGNNPIWYNDVLGNTFDEKSEKHVKKIDKRIERRESELNTNINNLESQIKNEIDKTKISDLNTQLETNKSYLQEVNGAKQELAQMKSSTQLFKVRSNSQLEGGAATSYDKSDNSVLIEYSSSLDANLSGLAHELKHGFDYIDGKISFTDTKGAFGALSDINDEVRGFKRELSFNPSWGSGKPLSVISADKVKTQSTVSFPGAPAEYPYAKLPDGNIDLNTPNMDLKGNYFFKR
ncbi:MAG: hypothetical protein ABL940_07160 [Bacteroidia bacterium]